MRVESADDLDRLERTCRSILESNGVSHSRIAFWSLVEDRTCIFEEHGKYYVGYVEPGRGLTSLTEYSTLEEAVYRLLGEEIYFEAVSRLRGSFGGS